jgi:hypothetical protein
MPWHFMGIGMMVLGAATILAARRGNALPLLATVAAVYILGTVAIAAFAGPKSAHLVVLLPGVLAALAAYLSRQV